MLVDKNKRIHDDSLSKEIYGKFIKYGKFM